MPNDDELTPTSRPAGGPDGKETASQTETTTVTDTAVATEEAPKSTRSNGDAQEFPRNLPNNDRATAEIRAHESETPEGPRSASDAHLFEQALQALDSSEPVEGRDSGYKKLTKGDKVEATVIQVDSDRVFVDLGTKSEGIVPIGELTDLHIEHASEHVSVGDKIQVVVLRPESAEGNPIVSKKRADFEESWLRIEEAYAKGTPITAPVIDRVKGGLVVDVGVRGFIPATHVGNGKLRNIDKFVGQTIECKVLEIDRERKKVVLSNRQAEEQRRHNAKERAFSTLKSGDVLQGNVRRLTDYGAFVDLGGVDGLLHISEMSWMRINHPREMFREGQKIQVMVLRLDKENGKISLGHRQVLPDPWNLIRENYRLNQKMTIKISRLVQSGAFVKLKEGAEAFLPLSEMSTRRLKRPQEAVEEGQDAEVQIIDLKPDERRMVLSMRALGASAGPQQTPAPSYGDDDRESKRGGKRRKKSRRQDEEELEEYVGGRRGFPGGGVTIGERLGMLKGFAGRDEGEELEVVEALEEVLEEKAAEDPGTGAEPSVKSKKAKGRGKKAAKSKSPVAEAETSGAE